MQPVCFFAWFSASPFPRSNISAQFLPLFTPHPPFSPSPIPSTAHSSAPRKKEISSNQSIELCGVDNLRPRLRALCPTQRIAGREQRRPIVETIVSSYPNKFHWMFAILILTPLFAPACKGPTAAPVVDPSKPPNNYHLILYATTFVNVLRADGAKSGAFEMSRQPAQDGCHHLHVEL